MALEKKIDEFFEIQNMFLNDLDSYSNGTWNSDKVDVLLPITNKLADLETRIAHIRRKITDRLLTTSNGYCPNCNQQLIEGLETCVHCNWNMGNLPPQKSTELIDSQKISRLIGVAGLITAMSLFHALLNTKEPE
jgi:DNA replicative helicase MCM subunit Mcm2 (Cdc46/Mcm family)